MTLENQPFIIRQIRQNYGITHKRKVWGVTRILRSTQALGNADNLRQHACKGAFIAYQSGIAEPRSVAEKSKGTPRHFSYRWRRKDSKCPEEFPQKSEAFTVRRQTRCNGRCTLETRKTETWQVG